MLRWEICTRVSVCVCFPSRQQSPMLVYSPHPSCMRTSRRALCVDVSPALMWQAESDLRASASANEHGLLQAYKCKTNANRSSLQLDEVARLMSNISVRIASSCARLGTLKVLVMWLLQHRRAWL